MRTRTEHILRWLAIIALAVFGYAFFLSRSDGPHEITAEERKRVLSKPAPNDAVELEAYDILADRLAVEAGTLIVKTDCAMEPLVLKLSEGATLLLRNEDDRTHTLAFESGGTFVLAPDYTKRLNVTEVFGKGSGAHRYRCDDLSTDENVGVLYIVP